MVIRDLTYNFVDLLLLVYELDGYIYRFDPSTFPTSGFGCFFTIVLLIAALSVILPFIFNRWGTSLLVFYLKMLNVGEYGF